MLRHDNADLRLTPIGYEIGLIPRSDISVSLHKKKMVEHGTGTASQDEGPAGGACSDDCWLTREQLFSIMLSMRCRLLRRPQITYAHIEQICPSPYELTDEMKEQVEIQVKYSGYIEKQLQQVERMQKMENKKIPEDIDYDEIHGLSTEGRQKLTKIRPISIGQASRISGVSPADISILLVYIEQYHKVLAARGS